VGGLGEHDGAEGGVLDGGAGGELAAAGGDLDDAVGLGLGEGRSAPLSVTMEVTLIAG
jgi:hypothetical protein